MTTYKNLVLQGFENQKNHGRNMEEKYSIDGVDYTIDQIIEEVKNETDIGNKFVEMYKQTIQEHYTLLDIPDELTSLKNGH